MDPSLLATAGMPVVVTDPAPTVFPGEIEALDDGRGLTSSLGTVAV
jgi:hypothetical protein